MKLEDEIVQKKFINEYHKLVVNIFYTNSWITKFNEKRFKEKDLSSQQYNILRILRGQYPKPASVNLLKERMLDKMPDVSRLVERLRKKDLLTRTDCPTDRRLSDILISEKGLAVLKELDSHLAEVEKYLSGLSSSEAKILNDLLDKLRG